MAPGYPPRFDDPVVVHRCNPIRSIVPSARGTFVNAGAGHGVSRKGSAAWRYTHRMERTARLPCRGGT
jgi:hypothetical protein